MMSAYLVQALKEVMQKIQARLDQHQDQVVATLSQVATGELQMTETLSPQEQENARVLFGWVAQEGPQRCLPRSSQSWPILPR